MFTGIIESLGIVEKIEQSGTNLIFNISSGITSELKVDQSLAHNGVCLTIIEISVPIYKVCAVEETLLKTNLKFIKPGDFINLERALKAESRIDGHFVQGHVDAVGVCSSITPVSGSWIFEFQFPKEYASLIIEKGSICINGVSLTVYNVTESQFNVSIIPYTYEHTNFRFIAQGDKVNYEFDVLGKYILRAINLQK